MENFTDSLTAEKITDGLETKFIGQNIIYRDVTESTNTLAKQNYSLPDGTLFIAESQTAGKGRLGRSWTSEKGVGIWMSILLKPSISPEEVSKITLGAGLAVCYALGNGAMIKYPNDIVIGTKKVCGILTEMSAEADKVNYVVCGIGINVNTEKFDGELTQKATSLFEVTGKEYGRCDIVKKVLCEFEKLYCEFIENGLNNIIEDYKKHCINIGADVHVIFQNNEITGKCVDITKDGAVVIESDGKNIEISSGEVSIRGIYGYV